MTIHIQIPEPLAQKVQDAAKSQDTSPEHYVLDAVTKTLADGAVVSTTKPSDETANPLLGLFSDEADLMDSIVEEAMHRRRTASMRTPRE